MGGNHRQTSALTAFDRLGPHWRRALPVLFLDYDATLAPIVERPLPATHSEEVRRCLEQLAEVLEGQPGT